MANFILTQGAPAKPFWEHIQDMQFDEADKKAAIARGEIEDDTVDEWCALLDRYLTVT